MVANLVGSTWKKWDLHVHTPESFYQNYPGSGEEAWEAFLADIESLAEEFKVIGINDYVLVDGYERVLKAKREQGRLKNIDLILPVVELRLDKFGGVVQGGKSGRAPSSWSRINIHVIFDQVDPDFIRQQFISAIAPSYRLLPGSTGEGKWNSVISRQSIEALGAAIIESVPADKRAEYGSPLIEGFNNLNVSADGLRRALENDALKGKLIVAVGKTEWENLKWDDHSIAEKKTLINDAQLVFTAAASPEDYHKAREKLSAAGVNSNLLDCSDAHWLSNSTDKDRIGNCFTWIKADSTFQGLCQAIQEFKHRVYVGDNPHKRALVAMNKTKFIRSVKVTKKSDSTLSEPWFNVDLPLNPDLVAIIGNKGSGKSALSDVVALVGNTRHHQKFSFLKDTRFRSPKTRFAHHFVAELTWHDGAPTSRDLDDDPDPIGVERVKYLPQSYLEDLCNELGDGGSATFDAELRKIIYSHVEEADNLGKASMDELLEFKVAEFNKARHALRLKVAKVNGEIVEAERRLTSEFKRSLEEQLAAKQAQLSALAMPQVVEDPSASEEALAESKEAADRIQALEGEIKKVEQEEADLRDKKVVASKRQATALRIHQALTNYKKQHETFLGELQPLLAGLGADISAEALVQLRVDLEPVDALAKRMDAEIDAIDVSLQSEEPGSYAKRKEELAASIVAAKGKLGERQRQFVLYKEDFSKWERAKAELIGGLDKPATIAWLQAEIASIETIPELLASLKKTRSDLATEIHGQIQAMVDEYKRLYGPVQGFVNSPEQREMNLPLDFQVRIEESGFAQQLSNRLNQRVRGSFSGVEESNQLLRTLLQEASFATPSDAVAFAETIDDMLHFDRREGQDGREIRLTDQLSRGTTAQDVLDFVFGLEYLSPRYSLTYDGQDIGQLSPGERGLLLLVFYLLVDKDDIPIVIDQPEENLDNQTIFKVLVRCIKRAKERRQVIIVTHNPNLAVVCDAEQLIYASCDKASKRFDYEAGAIENPSMKERVVEILEGTEPAFRNRQSKYALS
ncbi:MULTISPECIES: TrlF family AAA-like ATPase [Bradyrhizobium]|uniref:TrlF family AAA-like ATPase n=1 Tax=Bradyrhizobium TaxID=374 RepID=UPI000489A1C0|nr:MULTISPECIES: AAA family ATPase [Bradyrhizobium]UFW45395.1 AAA family ATPase [Bradyrhizobium arachidis]